MTPGELTILFAAGITLVTVGLIPSLLDGLQNGIQNFSASLSSPLPWKRPPEKPEPHPVRFWLAAIGLALIVAGILNISN